MMSIKTSPDIIYIAKFQLFVVLLYHFWWLNIHIPRRPASKLDILSSIPSFVGGHEITPIRSGRICQQPCQQDAPAFGGDQRCCYPCKIPSTVVSCLVENGVFLNDTNIQKNENRKSMTNDLPPLPPVFQDSVEKIYYKNNLSKIPDINDTGREFYTFDWYLYMPENLQNKFQQHLSHHFLQFRGISYRSTMYYTYNDETGGFIPVTNTTDGMWRRHTVDVTPYVRNNTLHNLFVRIEPPLHPGIVSSKCPTKAPSSKDHIPVTPCGQGGDHELAQDAGAMQFTAGWDWSQGIPDRVTGIFDIVQILHTQCVRVYDSYLQTNQIQLHNNNDTTKELVTAFMFGSTILVNNLDKLVAGHVCLEIIDDEIGKDNEKRKVVLRTSDVVSLKRRETKIHFWKNLTLSQVELWWPHTMGEPKLYSAKVYFVADNCMDCDLDSYRKVVSDYDEWKIGIRTISTSISTKLGGRLFSVNGQRIFLQGGNWIATDAMLQRGSKERYEDEVFLHRWAGLNFIRVWGGSLTERPDFYEACDRAGILVMQEFWMSGDNNGRWAGDYDWPHDQDSYLEQARDMVLMIRRHPSLMFYCAGNELWPSDKNPPPKIQQGLKQIITYFDSGRFLILSSMDGGFKGGNMSQHDDEYALTVKDGPYDMLTPVTYYAERNPGMMNGTIATVAFQAEIGSSSMPRFKTILRMGLGDNSFDFPNASIHYAPYLWKYHKFQPYSLRDVANNNSLVDGIEAYGIPKNIEDYVARAQLICWQQYQSLFEGFASKMFESYHVGGKSAVIMWKTQSPWPSLRGFLYDWWLDVTGSLEGVRIGSGGFHHFGHGDGSNLKIQLNPSTKRIELINRGRKGYPWKSCAAVNWYTLDGKRILYESNIQFVPVGAMSIHRSKAIQIPQSGRGQVLFVHVSFTWCCNEEESRSSNSIAKSSSWYWMSFTKTGGYAYDYKELGVWRDQGPYPMMTGRTKEFTFFKEQSKLTGSKWWKSTVAIHVDQSSKAIAFAPEYSAYDTDGNQLLPLFSNTPAVMLTNETTEVTLHGRFPKSKDNDCCVSRIEIDFWAGKRLIIPVLEELCREAIKTERSRKNYAEKPSRQNDIIIPNKGKNKFYQHNYFHFYWI